jgi:hypothetical protein
MDKVQSSFGRTPIREEPWFHPVLFRECDPIRASGKLCRFHSVQFGKMPSPSSWESAQNGVEVTQFLTVVNYDAYLNI